MIAEAPTFEAAALSAPPEENRLLGQSMGRIIRQIRLAEPRFGQPAPQKPRPRGPLPRLLATNPYRRETLRLYLLDLALYNAVLNPNSAEKRDFLLFKQTGLAPRDHELYNETFLRNSYILPEPPGVNMTFDRWATPWNEKSRLILQLARNLRIVRTAYPWPGDRDIAFFAFRDAFGGYFRKYLQELLATGNVSPQGIKDGISFFIAMDMPKFFHAIERRMKKIARKALRRALIRAVVIAAAGIALGAILPQMVGVVAKQGISRAGSALSKQTVEKLKKAAQSFQVEYPAFAAEITRVLDLMEEGQKAAPPARLAEPVKKFRVPWWGWFGGAALALLLLLSSLGKGKRWRSHRSQPLRV